MMVMDGDIAMAQVSWQFGFEFKAERPFFVKQHVFPKGKHAATWQV
jgi:hypothetical protein